MKKIIPYIISFFVLNLIFAGDSFSQLQIDSVVTKDVSCNGTSNGEFVVYVSGGTAPYIYTFSTLAKDTVPDTVYTYTGLSSGNYWIVVEELNGAGWKSKNDNIEAPEELSIDTIKTFDLTCSGSDDGRIIAVAAGGTIPYTYILSDAGTPIDTIVSSDSAEFTGLPIGNQYSVELDDANECGPISDGPYTIDGPTAITITLEPGSKDSLDCYNDSDGSLDITAAGGAGGYSYEWSTDDGSGLSDNDEDQTGLTGGTYNVTVTDISSCTSDTSFTIYEPDSLQLSISVKKELRCYDGSDAQLEAMPVGGTTSYGYKWSDGQTTKVAAGLSRGLYNCTVTDRNNCVVSSGILYEDGFAYNGPDEITFDASDHTDACESENNGTLTIHANGGCCNEFEYSITSEDAGYQADSLFTNLAPGTYPVWVRDDSLCTQEEDSVTIAMIPKPTADAGPDTTICSDGNYYIGPSDTSNASYLIWSNGGGDGTFDDANVLHPTYTPGPTDITNGSVTLTLKAAGSTLCDTASNSMTLTITQAPSVDAGTDDSTCVDKAYTVSTASAGNVSSVLWRHNGTGNLTNANTLSPTYTPAPAESGATVTLTLTGYGNIGCDSIQDNMNLDIAPLPTANAGNNDSTCIDKAYTVSGASATNYSSINWTHNGNGNLANQNTLTPTYTPGVGDEGNAITLTLQVNGYTNCNAVTDNMDLEVVPGPTANAGSDDSTCIDKAYTVSGTSATNYSSINWTHNGNGNLTNANTLTPTYTPGVGDEGTTVTLTLTANGLTSCNPDTDDMDLEISPAPTANAGDNDSTCISDPFTVGTASATNYISLQWSHNGNGNLANQNTLTPTYTPGVGDEGNTITLTLQVNGYTNCNAVTDNMDLEIVAGPTANAGSDDSTCIDKAYTVSGASATNYSSLNWTHNGNGNLTNTGTLTPTYTPGVGDEGTTVTLTLTANGLTSCNPDADDMDLEISPAPTANAGDNDSTCISDPFTVSTASATNYISLQWSHNGNGNLANQNTLTPTYTPGVGDEGNTITLTLQVNGYTNCNAVTDNMDLEVVAGPTANAGSDDSTCINEAYTVSGASATNYSSLNWTHNGNGNLTNANTLTPTYTPGVGDEGTTVTLTLTANGLTSCNPDTDDMDMEISPAPTANAGDNDSTCISDPFTVSTASATNYISLQWSHNGNGNLANQNTLTPTYTPGVGDEGNTITLTLQVNGYTNCNAVTDNMDLEVVPGPTTNAGSDDSTCINEAYTVSGATATNYSSLNWTHNGNGNLTDVNTLTPTYTPGAGDEGNTVTLTLNANGLSTCPPASDDMSLEVVSAPAADAGSDDSTCIDKAYTISGASASNYSSLNWTHNGNGNLTNTGTLTPTYTPGVGDEGTTVTLTLQVNGLTNCNPVTDDMDIEVVPVPTVDAGINDSTCSGDPFTVSTASATNYVSLQWSHNGAGNLTNENTLTPTYTPGVGDEGNTITLTLQVNGHTNCDAATDDMNLDVVPGPTADADNNDSTCINEAYTISGASATNYSSLVWIHNGNGNLTNANTLTPTYTPGAGDEGNTVTLTLTANGLSSCPLAADGMDLEVVPAPIANAGSDDSTCIDKAYTISGASASNYSSLVWSHNGNGNLTNAGTLTPTYTPASGDEGATVTLTLQVNGLANCNPATDDMDISVVQAPSADAGIDDSTCVDKDYIITTATADNYASINWSHNGTGTLSGSGTLSPTYSPASGDIGNTVTLTITANGASSCDPASDQMDLIIIDAPTANTGGDTSICENENYIIPVGRAIASNQMSVYWTTAGDGSFTDANTLIPTYNPGSSDIANGTVDLSLHAVGYTNCDEAIHTMTLTITSAPVSEAGPDTSICYGSTVQITNANATGYSNITWRSSGDGTFDDNGIIDPVYTPGPVDMTGDSVTLYLDADGIGACGVVTDSMTLYLPEALDVSIGSTSPFIIGANTKISVSFTTSNHDIIQDLGYFLVAPDGMTIVDLKRSPMENGSIGLCNAGTDADSLIFTTEKGIDDTLDICNESAPLSGVFAATGDWSKLYDMNPSQGGWSVMVSDCWNSTPPSIGELVHATIEFSDSTAGGEYASVVYKSGPINKTIKQPSAGCASTYYQVPMGIRTSCYETCDAEAIVTVTGGTKPYVDYNWSDPVVPDNDSVKLCAGSYTVTVTDALGCTGTASIEVIQPDSISIDSLTYTDYLCANDSSGIIDINASGGTGSLTYILNPDSLASNSTGLFTGLPGGDYLVDIIDANGCTKTSDTIKIRELDAIIIDTLEVQSLTCHDFDNGAINIKASGGADTFNYMLLDADTVLIESNPQGYFDSLSPGNYHVRVIDSNNCYIMTDTLSVINPDELIIDSTDVSPVVCYGENNGQITVHASGGTKPYRYSIMGDIDTLYQADSLFTELLPGQYIPAVRDTNGCPATNNEADTITIATPSIFKIDSIQANNVQTCYGENTGTVSVFVDYGGNKDSLSYYLMYSYDTIVQDTGYFTNLYADSNIIIMITDTAGCTKFDTTDITQPPRIILDTIITTDIRGDTLGSIDTIAAYGGSGPLTYYVDTINMDIDSLYSSRTMYDSLKEGWYYVFVKDTNDCKVNDSVYISSLQVNINITDVTCYGDSNGSISITPRNGSKPYHYSIDGGLNYDTVNADTTFTYTNLSGGNYSVQVIDDFGSQFNRVVKVKQPDSLQIDNILVTDISGCFGDMNGAIEVIVSGGTPEYRYYLDTNAIYYDSLITGIGSSSQQIIHDTVYVLDTNGCMTFDTFSIIQPPQIIIDHIWKSNVSGTQPGSIDSIAAHGGSGELTFYVDSVSISSLLNVPDSLYAPLDMADSLYDTLYGGTYYIAVKDTAGCKVVDSKRIYENLLDVIVNIHEHDTCRNNEGIFNFEINNGTPDFYYLIEVLEVQIDTVKNDTVLIPIDTIDKNRDRIISDPAPYSHFRYSGLSGGKYRLYVEDDQGKAFDTIFYIFAPDPVHVFASIDSANCLSILSGHTDVGAIKIDSVHGGSPPFVYSWDNSSWITARTGSEVSGLTAGTYELGMSDINDCNYDTSFFVNYSSFINVDMKEPDTADICYGDSVTFTLNMSSNATVEWFVLNSQTNYFSEHTSEEIIGTNNKLNVFPGKDYYPHRDSFNQYIVYRALAYDSLYCANDDEAYVFLNPDISIYPEPDTIQLVSNGIKELERVVYNEGQRIISYEWDNINRYGTINKENEKIAEFSGLEENEGTHISLKVKNEYQCEATDTFWVERWDGFIPSGFSPNDDGHNDFWEIEIGKEDQVDVTVQVFNRWGERIFQASDYYNEWDGKRNGKDIPVGTYYYIITVDDGTQVKKFAGPLTIIR